MSWTFDRRPKVADAPGQANPSSSASWAHASGWMQLSGARQTVSCVLPCENQAVRLSGLLPTLSDALTECGYPWELIVVDQGSRDETPLLLEAWTELPGFRCIMLDPEEPAGSGFARGLMAARGDAVLLIDPATRHPTELIPRMMPIWESDALLVHATTDSASGLSLLAHWDESETQRRIADPSFTLPLECTEMGLLDRQLVNWLVQGA